MGARGSYVARGGSVSSFLGYDCLAADTSGLMGGFFLAADEPFSCCGSFSHCGYSVGSMVLEAVFVGVSSIHGGVRTMSVRG